MSARWYGIDPASGTVLEVSAKSSRAAGRVPADGMGVAVAVPMDSVTAERLDFGAVPSAKAAKLVRGRLDTILPMPVEECAVAAVPEGGAGASFMAYAMPLQRLAELRSDVRGKFGCDAEFLVPAAAALWRGANRLGSAVHLHVSGSGWLMLAGEGVRLASVVNIAVGDVRGVVRSLSILGAGQGAGRVSVSGSSAASVAAELSPLGVAANVVPGADAFLAKSAAEFAAENALIQEGNLADAASRRGGGLSRTLSLYAPSLAFLFVAASLFMSASLFRAHRARAALERTESEMTEFASKIAGRQVSQKGAVALELARNEFESRLNPVVESISNRRGIGMLGTAFSIAAVRDIKFSSIELRDGAMSFAGHASSEDDLAKWRSAAAADGVALSIDAEPVESGVNFKATQLCVGGQAQ